MKNEQIKRKLKRAYLLMRERFGYQDWWPGDSDFEICIGAILTQNTAWSNVEKAINNIKSANLLDPEKLYSLPLNQLARLIRPAGYFNVKARRLRNFLEVLVNDYNGSVQKMLSGEKDIIRERLLKINGIGKETADSMMLYAGTHLSFVIDAYTKRIFSRHGWSEKDCEYDELKQLCENSLNDKPPGELLDYWRDYHAQLVMVGKNYCKTRNPECNECPLYELLEG